MYKVGLQNKRAYWHLQWWLMFMIVSSVTLQDYIFIPWSTSAVIYRERIGERVAAYLLPASTPSLTLPSWRSGSSSPDSQSIAVPLAAWLSLPTDKYAGAGLSAIQFIWYPSVSTPTRQTPEQVTFVWACTKVCM